MGTEDDLGSTLFGKTRRAVLTLTYGHPEEAYHLRRIARFAATGQGVLQRELRQLTAAGILTRRVTGRQTYYQANRDCPIFEDLRSVVIKTAGLVDVLRAAIARLGERVAIAFVHGSFARGRQRPGSDVDVLVIGDVDFGEVAETLATAEQRLAREVNPTVFPRREFQAKVRAGQHFVTRVLAEAKLFLIGNQRELERLAQERLAD